MNTPQPTDGAADPHGRLVRSLRRLVEAADFDELTTILDAGVVLLIDGGGQVAVALEPVRGVVDVAARLLGLLGPDTGTTMVERSVNGQRGLLAHRGQLVVAVVTVSIRGDRITDVWVVVNPDKLGGFNRR